MIEETEQQQYERHKAAILARWKTLKAFSEDAKVSYTHLFDALSGGEAEVAAFIASVNVSPKNAYVCPLLFPNMQQFVLRELGITVKQFAEDAGLKYLKVWGVLSGRLSRYTAFSRLLLEIAKEKGFNPEKDYAPPKKKRLRKICGNCKFAGDAFKLGKVTHYHCQHPSYDEEMSAWETLRVFSDSCEKHK